MNLKVVVIDDEAIVLQGIQTMLDWQALELDLVGMEQNGEAGLAMIRRVKPDIVITDIRMPGMLGLEMIRKAEVTTPGIQYIILSGYSEFEYAQQAIAAGVYAYLEKPFSVEELSEKLVEVRDIINKKRREADRMVRMQRDSLKKLFHEALEVEVNATEDNLNTDYDLAGLNTVCVVTCRVLGQDKDIPAFERLSADVLDQLMNCGHYIQVVDEDILIAVLLICKAMPEKQIVTMLDQYRYRLGMAGYVCRIGAGIGKVGSVSLSNPYAKALNALHDADTQGLSGLHLRGQNGESGSVSVVEERNLVLECVRNGEKQRAELAIEAFLDSLIVQKAYVKRLHHECLALIYNSVEQKGIVNQGKLNDWIYNEEMPHVRIPRLNNTQELREYMLGLFDRMIDQIQTESQTASNPLIIKAMRYIDTHYSQDLTLKKLSEVVGLNASYFCVVFREDAGISYSKYLLNVRMNHAMALLRTGEKVTVVSEKVGYYNYRHFCETFKKHVGMTPKQYRNLPNK